MVRKAIRRLVIVGLALLVLAPVTPAWGRSLRSLIYRVVRPGGKVVQVHSPQVFHINVFQAPHAFPHHSRRDSLSTSKRVWVPGRWEKSTHDVLIWRTGHWTINEPSSE